MDKEDKVFCIDESTYSEHITKRQRYFVTDTKEGQIRIKNNRQKLVWLPDRCFADNSIPDIESINIDDKINDPENDCVEVTIKFDNGEKRWATFTTIKWLKNLLKESSNYVTGAGFIFLKVINKENIELAITELDKQNKLIELTQKYE